MRAGRSLDALLAAYRLGARVAWRRLAAAGERAGLPPRTLYTLAEAIFAYIDELSADSIEGYAREQTAAAGALQRRRQGLAALLVQDPPAAPATVESAAANAAWRLPRSVAVLVIEAEGEEPGGGAPVEQADRLGLRLGPEALVAHVAPYIVAVVPAPANRRELERAVRDRPAALGPQGPWQQAAVSFARAREVLRLAGEGSIDGYDSLLVAERHKLSLLLGADRRLARDVAESALAPLASETERAARLDPRRLAAPPRPHRGGREGASRAPADRPLPARAAARAVRFAPRRPRRALRAGAGTARASHRRGENVGSRLAGGKRRLARTACSRVRSAHGRTARRARRRRHRCLFRHR
jgi:hypothetical protein